MPAVGARASALRDPVVIVGGLEQFFEHALVVAAVTVSGYVISRTYQGTEEDIDEELIFEEIAPARFELLDLRGGI